MIFWGMVLPEYRAGRLRSAPGRPVADVIESGKMEVRAKIDESDRTNLSRVSQRSVEVDALPGETFTAQVGALSGLASRAQLLRVSAASRGSSTSRFSSTSPIRGSRPARPRA